MLLFSTVLDIDKSMTKDNFIKLVIEWNQQSTYTQNIIPDIIWKGERSIKWGTLDLWMQVEEFRKENIIAIRFEKKEKDGAIWDTDYVMNFNSYKMAIRLDRSYLEDAIMIDSSFSTPHFITLLIEKGYLKKDYSLPVLRTPVELNDDNIKLLMDVMNGKNPFRLPIVYISKTKNNKNPIDVGRLAGRLKGVAHVFVEQSVQQNKQLMDATNRQNEFHGAIGVYFPSQSYKHRRFYYVPQGEVNVSLSERVIRCVVAYSNSQRVEPLYTWQGVSNELLRYRFVNQKKAFTEAEETLKFTKKQHNDLLESLNEREKQVRQNALEQARLEAEALLKDFDQELAQLQQSVEALTKIVDSLTYENIGLKNKLNSSDTTPLLYMGDECDLYQDEIKDILLAILSDSLNGLPAGTRRYDIVKDIVRANPYEKLSEEKTKQVKALLSDFKGMTPKLRQGLIDLGFVITEDGKHYKMTYYGDGRYQFTIAKTPSDGRAGKNNAAVISKTCF